MRRRAAIVVVVATTVGLAMSGPLAQASSRSTNRQKATIGRRVQSALLSPSGRSLSEQMADIAGDPAFRQSALKMAARSDLGLSPGDKEMLRLGAALSSPTNAKMLQSIVRGTPLASGDRARLRAATIKIVNTKAVRIAAFKGLLLKRHPDKLRELLDHTGSAPVGHYDQLSADPSLQGVARTLGSANYAAFANVMSAAVRDPGAVQAFGQLPPVGLASLVTTGEGPARAARTAAGDKFQVDVIAVVEKFLVDEVLAAAVKEAVLVELYALALPVETTLWAGLILGLPILVEVTAVVGAMAAGLAIYELGVALGEIFATYLDSLDEPPPPTEATTPPTTPTTISATTTTLVSGSTSTTELSTVPPCLLPTTSLGCTTSVP